LLLLTRLLAATLLAALLTTLLATLLLLTGLLVGILVLAHSAFPPTLSAFESGDRPRNLTPVRQRPVKCIVPVELVPSVG
jgi:hypothetical protein